MQYGKMTTDLSLAGSSLRLYEGEIVKLSPASNLPEGSSAVYYATPVSGEWGDFASMPISSDEVEPLSDHEEKYTRLARRLGWQALLSLVPATRVRVRRALDEGDVHLNTISLSSWDTAALDQSTKAPKSKKCSYCGSSVRNPKHPSSLYGPNQPYERLKQTARDPRLPWYREPGLSLAERVCVLKLVAKNEARRLQ